MFVSVVQEIIYCIVFLKSLNERDPGKILNSVIDKLNFILQPLLFTHLLVTK